MSLSNNQAISSAACENVSQAFDTQHVPCSNAAYTDEYFALMRSFDNDVAGRRAARTYMQNSTAIVHHQVVESTFIPRLFNKKTYDTMKQTAETAHRILTKVITRYLEDPHYRRIFSFDPRLEELILLPRGYNSVLPFARVDTFLNEDTYQIKFCEFNADGSSGMNENREITSSIWNSRTFQAFSEHHFVQACELFDSWVNTFLAIYETYEHRVSQPHVAIVDFLENAVIDEFRVFSELFSQHDITCSIADVRNLTFDGTALRDSTGQQIHALWRRCVTNDIMEHWEESQPLIEAVRAEKVALIGSFAGHIVHDKQIFRALFDPATLAFLTAEEITFIEETVPLTAFLDDEHVNIAQIRRNKDEWIIKPTDHYGADHVYAGCYVDQTEWEHLIDRFANARAGYPFIVQRYIQPFRTQTLPPDKIFDDSTSTTPVTSATKPAYYNNLNGLYLYDGIFMGVFSRLGPRPTISKDMEGITAATIWVKEE